MPDLDYSFSGLKTSFLYFIRDELKKNPNFIEENLNDICASIQHAIVEQLMRKLEKACKETGIKQISLAGGVSANSYLRMRIEEFAIKKKMLSFIPAFEYCTDNAGMIAMAGDILYQREVFEKLDTAPFAR
jgi:N6-L-threonylcarbamoyladenine synthase